MKKIYLMAVASALITSIFVYLYISANKSKGNTITPQLQKIFIASVDIPRGTIIKDTMVTPQSVSFTFPSTIFESDRKNIIGMVAKGEILAGEPINRQRLGKVGSKENEGLGYELPKGTCAITIPVDESSSVANQVQKGDKVDVIQILKPQTSTSTTMEPSYLLKDIEVALVGTPSPKPTTTNPDEAEKKETNAPPTYQSVTLIVTSEQAISLLFALANGSVKLVLKPAILYTE